MAVFQAKRLEELEKENSRLRKAVSDLTLDRQDDPAGGGPGKPISPSSRKVRVKKVCEGRGVSEWRACRVLSQHRLTRWHVAIAREGEEALTKPIVELACRFGLYGYRQITALLRPSGYQVNATRGSGSADGRAAKSLPGS